MGKISINLGDDSYYINIGENILEAKEPVKYKGYKTMVITDENVSRLYSSKILSLLDGEAYKYVIKAGESSKTLETVGQICEKMLELGFTRNSKVLALGGGVVGDIAGFVASVYMRGIDFISIPTTLLACVDSSVGGKTGVNLPAGKNIIGSFHQPESVWIDLTFLESLPAREVKSGIGEIIKYGIIWDYEFFKYIKANIGKLLSLEKETLKHTIIRSCEIKAKVVSMDEKETDIRKILNQGHTIAHGIEAQTAYKRYKHGEAVLIGIYYESLMAKKMGLIKEEYFKEIAGLVKALEVDLELNFPKEELLEKMMHDKKNRGGKISFILPDGKGSVKEVFLSKEEVEW